MEKKEAMKILKEFHDKSALFSVRTALDTVIPELAESEQRTASRGMMWVCRCDCGREKTISAQALVKGVTVSCGCYNKEVNSEHAIHGHNRRIGGRSK